MLGEAVRALFTARWHAAGVLYEKFFLPLPLRQPGSTTVSLCQSLPMLLGTVHQILVNESGCLCKGCKINTCTSESVHFPPIFLCRYNHFRLGVTEKYQKMHQLDKNRSMNTIYWVISLSMSVYILSFCYFINMSFPDLWKASSVYLIESFLLG